MQRHWAPWLLALTTAVGCSKASVGDDAPSTDASTQPVTACRSTAIADGWDAVDPAQLHVYLDAPGLSDGDVLSADLSSYLGRLWGTPITVVQGTPAAGDAWALWVSTGDDAKAAASAPATGYTLARVDGDGTHRLIVSSSDPRTLVHGAYALLEELGARFFHPKQELVPQLPGPRWPTSMNIHREAAWRLRGVQPHVLHPLEYFKVFNGGTDADLADAEQYVDWLVKTGQNHVQWPLLSTVDFAPWKATTEKLIAYAHRRGVTLGASIEMFDGSSLQNNFVLIKDTANWQPELEAGLDQVAGVGFDLVELALGEFIGTDPGSVVQWLDHAMEYMAAKHPQAEVSVENHVGNYPNLWVQYMGQKVFFYHLPQFADPRLTNNVHTVFFFDLYRDWGTYKHPNFFLQRDYIFQELPKRKVRYFPESAYWIEADIDVPAFLPEYIYARWLDISSLRKDIASKGLPNLDGHVQFTSGHEWGYWLTDYLTAKMQWQPDATLDTILADHARAFGNCADDVRASMSKMIDLQSRYLFDQKLVGYISGEDIVIDVGTLGGFESHPKRVAFETVAAMSAADRATFESTVVAPLEAMVGELTPLENDWQSRCDGVDAALGPWCRELYDGYEIVRLRAAHSAQLYRAVLAQAAGDGTAGDWVKKAAATTDVAAEVIARREKEYRFDLSRNVDAFKNPTHYAFGYLRQAHTQCLWRRQEQQAQYLLDNGVAAPLSILPTCQN